LGKDRRSRSEEFTHLVSPCGERADPVFTVFIGENDQVVLRIKGAGDLEGSADWLVPDDHLGHIHAQTLNQPVLLGVGARDAYFDTAPALIRYPVYDEIKLCRAGDFMGGCAVSRPCNQFLCDIPPSEFYKIASVGDLSISIIGPKGPVEVKCSPDDGATPPPPPSSVSKTGKYPPPRPDPLMDAVEHDPRYWGANAQSIGTSNWSNAPFKDLKITKGNDTYAQRSQIRPGRGVSSESRVTEITLSGTFHVSYMDDKGKSHEAEFRDVPSEEGTHYPHREFYFDARGRVLLCTFDLNDDPALGNERWCLPVADGSPEKAVPIPELLGTAPLSVMTLTWDALIRYPKNDQIGKYQEGQMLGGAPDDFASRQTADGAARYRIESIAADHMVLVRDGKRLTVPLIAGERR
jgi:hypothetical protein